MILQHLTYLHFKQREECFQEDADPTFAAGEVKMDQQQRECRHVAPRKVLKHAARKRSLTGRERGAVGGLEETADHQCVSCWKSCDLKSLCHFTVCRAAKCVRQVPTSSAGYRTQIQTPTQGLATNNSTFYPLNSSFRNPKNPKIWSSLRLRWLSDSVIGLFSNTLTHQKVQSVPGMTEHC